MMKVIKTMVISFFLLNILACNQAKDNRRDGEIFTEAESGKAEISFQEYEHDFGKVKEGEKVACVFSFCNTGEGSLVIESVSASCGCTVPKYDKKPVPPGKNGMIEVAFNTAGRSGIQTKTVTVRSNAGTPVVILKLTAEVF
ncbi:MAG: DUF1573 domain-containing protein [Bacteroidales bacterium]|jgi:hypothetical protein